MVIPGTAAYRGSEVGTGRESVSAIFLGEGQHKVFLCFDGHRRGQHMAYRGRDFVEIMGKQWSETLADMGLLTGWKRIARFMGVSIQTAKRLATRYSMPVRRLPPDRPFAVPFELLTWAVKFDEIRQELLARHAGKEMDEK